jgi:hypothetical protein
MGFAPLRLTMNRTRDDAIFVLDRGVSVTPPVWRADFAGGAAELASYQFNNTRASEDTDPNSTAGDFFDGPGVVAVYSILGAPAPSLGINYAQIDGITEAAAFAAEDYVAFTVAPAIGGDLDLTSLTYACIGGAPSFGPMTFFVRSSVDGYAATLDTVTRTNQFPTGRTVNPHQRIIPEPHLARHVPLLSL